MTTIEQDFKDATDNVTRDGKDCLAVLTKEQLIQIKLSAYKAGMTEAAEECRK